jgi:hypothetical protein
MILFIKCQTAFSVFCCVARNNKTRRFLVWINSFKFRYNSMNGDRPVPTEKNTLNYFHREELRWRSASGLSPRVWSLWPEERAVWVLECGHCDQRSERYESSSVVTVTRGASGMSPRVWSLWPGERAVWVLECGHCDQGSEQYESSSVVTVTRGASSLRPRVW